jgi:peptidoglycan DL-endopeptidase CwlO
VPRSRVHSVQPVLRRPARLRTVFAAALSVITALALTGTPAHADPSVSEVEAQLNDAWRRAEPLIEQYNAVHEQYVANKAKQDELLAQIAPLARELELAQAQVGAMAAKAYMGGQADAFNAIIEARSPAELADQLIFLDGLARDQVHQMRAVFDAKAQYDAQKAPIDEVVAQLAVQDADLAAKRQDIQARLTELQALRIKAYGTTGGTGAYRPWVCPAEYLPTPGYTAAAFACSQAGEPYVWGAAGPDVWDCSGITMVAWQQAGVFLPHNAAAQRRSMPYVDRADLQIGDLVFYYSDLSHVTIYVGDGKVISAPMSGDVVRMQTLDGGSPIHSFGRPG